MGKKKAGKLKIIMLGDGVILLLLLLNFTVFTYMNLQVYSDESSVPALLILYFKQISLVIYST